MADPFPDYDVLAKRGTLAWNPQTRKVVEDRLALQIPPHPLSDTQLATLRRAVARVVPDPEGRPPTTTLAMVVRKIAEDGRDGHRHHALPGTQECWLRGLDAIEAEAQARRSFAFATLPDVEADTVLECIAQGDVRAPDWDTLPAKLFWFWRLLPDCVSAHWAQPSLWSAMGFGGPASPQGYVRTGIDRRDPWEAIEAGETLRGLPRHHG